MATVHSPSKGRRRPRPATTFVLAALRLTGAGLLATNAGIHAHLWGSGYRSIPTIGTLFLLAVIGASILAAAVLVAPRRQLSIVAVLGALFELGTVSGLWLSTVHSLFGFQESTRATLYWASADTEVAGALVLCALAALTYRALRGSPTGPRW